MKLRHMKFRHIVYLLVAIYTLILTIGVMNFSFDKPDRVEDQKIENVVRVFWHEELSYSVMVSEPSTNQLRLIRLIGFLFLSF